MEHNYFGSGTVMVWGCILYDRRADLRIIRGNLTRQRYPNQTLLPVVVPTAIRVGRNNVFQVGNGHRIERVFR